MSLNEGDTVKVRRLQGSKVGDVKMGKVVVGKLREMEIVVEDEDGKTAKRIPVKTGGIAIKPEEK